MLVLVVMLLCFLLTRLARTRRQRVVVALPLAGVILFLAFEAGCGGGVGRNLHDYGYRYFREQQHDAYRDPAVDRQLS